MGAAISLFGFRPGTSLATLAGALIEVPLMRSMASLVNRTRGGYERGTAA